MSGINAGIYPLPTEIETTYNLIAENATLLDEISGLEEQTETNIIITNSTLRPVALSLNNELAGLNSDNGIFIQNDAGEFLTDSPVAKPAVATPTVLATLLLDNDGIWMVSYNFSIYTNTPDGDPTPLTSAFVTWLLNGVSLPDYTMTFYPNSAISRKNGNEIVVSGVIPIQVNEIAIELVMRVNVAPEDAGLDTTADNIYLNAVLVSPYFIEP
jgi:hypothetical protein